MSEERVDEALRALRSADGRVETGEGAEVRALLGFRRQRRRRRFQRVTWACTMVTAIAALVIALRAPAPPQHEQVIVLEIPPAPVPPSLTLEPVKRQRQPREIVTPFYPLMPSAPPLESALLVRVTVQASALRSVGIPVSDDHLSDPVLADVLVGQDDLARAIRFVSYQ
jgi:hypothetical protein